MMPLSAVGVIGIGPVSEMLAYAKQRGLDPVLGIAETLPFMDDSFDYALSITTICFVDDIIAMLNEAKRVLKPEGTLTIDFIDKNTRLGQHYLKHQADSFFYQNANFPTSEYIKTLLQKAGFVDLTWVQTLFFRKRVTRLNRTHHAWLRTRVLCAG